MSTFTSVADSITAAKAYMVTNNLVSMPVSEWSRQEHTEFRNTTAATGSEPAIPPFPYDWITYLENNGLGDDLTLDAGLDSVSDLSDDPTNLDHVLIVSGYTPLPALTVSVTTGPAIPEPTGSVELFSVADFSGPTITAASGSLPSGLGSSFEFADAAAPTNAELLEYTRILENNLASAFDRQNDLLNFCLELKAQIDRLSA